MNMLGEELNLSVDKIRNWFKHQRKKEVLQGKRNFDVKKYFNKNLYFCFIYSSLFLSHKKKNSFSKQKIAILLEEFQKNTNPSSLEYEKM